ncbi:SAG-related sequence [Besnoitia besnoiti]|uniref:SAG-related sequence n=1 Tax=Besnoitia besnoiti TaxID=94643 RepID=A0A2A9MNG9_BESBE|nr:SAG-related sequence [Besnoitia besnoiti]PFH37766.1 SAG-related sequence [Besnoitia besnoiti]
MKGYARFLRQCGAFIPMPRKWMAVCGGAVLLLSMGHAAANHRDQDLLRRPLAERDATASLDSVITCNATSQEEEPGKPLELTLSVDRASGTLQCTGEGNTVVPSDGALVCDSKDSKATVKLCQEEKPGGAKVPLKQLLESSDEVTASISSLTNEENSPGQLWKLELNDSQFPLVDKSFFVGCQTKNPSDSKCKVTLNVEARPSSVQDSTVTCAYGKDSNPAPLEVVLTERKNTMTLNCGKDGSFQPTNYSTIYCGGESLQNCTKSFTEILPNFQETWWTKAEPGTKPAVLTIPSAEFPNENRTFYIGCSLTQSNHVSPEGLPSARTSSDPSPGAAASSTCKVKVTVNSASSGSGVSAAAGFGFPILVAAGLTGLAAGFTCA